MKKLLFFSAIGAMAFTTQAQESSSVMFGRTTKPAIKSAGVPVSQEKLQQMRDWYLSKAKASHGTNSGARTTSTTSYTNQDWYDMVDQWSPLTGTSPEIIYYWTMFADTNLYDASLTSNVHNQIMGMSFDPTDSSYFSQYPSVNGGALVSPVNYPLPPTNSAYPLANPIYIVDSAFIPAVYVRYDPSVAADTLIIEFSVAMNTVVSTNDTGAYNLNFNDSSINTPYAYDGEPRFSDVHYNAGVAADGTPWSAAPYINDCYFDSVYVPKQRYALVLNAAAFADTTAGGYLNLGDLSGYVMVGSTVTAIAGHPAGGFPLLSLISPFTIDATTGLNPHLVTMVSFKSGHAGGTYPLNTPTTSANWLKLFAGDPLGTPTSSGPWFMQSSHNTATGYDGSFEAALSTYYTQRYSNSVYDYSGHEIPIPGFGFTEPVVDVFYESLHIQWNPTTATGVNNVKTLDFVNVYPNPANDQLNVTFGNALNSAAKVSLTNMVGQVVATQNVAGSSVVFSTSSLPAGVYIYNITCDGNRSTGQVVIAH